MLTRRSLFGLALVPLAPVVEAFQPSNTSWWEIDWGESYSFEPMPDEKVIGYFKEVTWQKWYPLHDRRDLNL